jgi:glycosyltransferase involved in cell wall biosynthesis
MQALLIGKGWFPEEPGGLNRYFYDCVNALPKVGVEVQGLVAGSEQGLAGSEHWVRTFARPNDSLWTRWSGIRRAMAQTLNQQPPAVVVSHFSLYTFPVLSQLDRYPLVVHFHGPWALEGKAEGGNTVAIQLKKWVEQVCYRRAVTFIVLSKAFQEILHREYGVPLGLIHVVPGGVCAEHFDINLSPLQAREILGWQPEAPTFVAVRRLAHRMGLENLIEAIAQVRQHHPTVQLKLVGKGALQESLLTMINDRDLSANVELLGYIPDEKLPLIYRAADCSVMPTISLEGFGLSIVESLAAGTPVLGTDVGGIPEILSPLSPQLMLAGAAPDQLAAGLGAVLSGTRTLPSAAECRAYVHQHFDWPIVAQQLQEIYANAAKGALA